MLATCVTLLLALSYFSPQAYGFPFNSFAARCTGGKVFQLCGSACPNTCAFPNRVCPRIQRCVPGCQCPKGTVENKRTRKCMPLRQCPIQIRANCIGGKIFRGCGSPCPPTCDRLTGRKCVFRCVSGCQCPRGQTEHTDRNGDTRCIRLEKCPKPTPKPKPVCTGGKVFLECGSPCPRTCKNAKLPFVPCPKICHAGCQCPQGLVENNATKQCVRPEECPPPTGQTCAGDKIHTSCGTMCPLTCGTAPGPCPLVCVKGCQCPPGLYSINGTDRCVQRKNCPPRQKLSDLKDDLFKPLDDWFEKNEKGDKGNAFDEEEHDCKKGEKGEEGWAVEGTGSGDD